MTTENDRQLAEVLGNLYDSDVPVETRSQSLVLLRANRADLSPLIDEALIRRHDGQCAAIDALGEVVDELKRLASKLTSAPIREGVFVGRVTLADGRTLARVVAGSQDALLGVADEALLDELRPGDRVHLTSAGNAVLDKADGASLESGECAVAERWIEDGRLLIRHRDQTLVVPAAATLSRESLKAGDTVRLDRISGIAMERVDTGESSRYGASDEATSLPPEAFAGYDDIRDGTLRRITHAVAHPELASRYGIRHRRPWILLGGPPGGGKTTLARVIAGVLQQQTGRACLIRKVNGAELLSPYVGETERRIRTLVRETAAGEDWSILFLDEVDAIARARGGTGNVHSDRFMSTWLSELEGFEGRSRFILVAATNRIDMLDPAFRARFSTEIEVPRPRMEGARAIFARHLAPQYRYFAGEADPDATRRAMVDTAVAKLYLPNAAGARVATLRLRDGTTRTVFARDLMSGRLIEQICVDACERAFQRHVDGEASGLRVEDIDTAVEAACERLRATLTPRNVHAYLADIPPDLGVVAVEPAPRLRAGVTFLRQAAQ